MKKKVKNVIALSLILSATLVTTNKNVVEEVPKAVVKPEKDYYKSCIKSIRCRWLAEALYYESRSESDRGVAAVAYVILNRVNHPTLWPSTVAGVIKQKSQFSYRFDGSLKKGFTEQSQYVRVATIAAKAIDGSIKNPVGKATHYHIKNISTSWSKKKTVVAVIDNHIFFR